MLAQASIHRPSSAHPAKLEPTPLWMLACASMTKQIDESSA
jgi:hypothetical protein